MVGKEYEIPAELVAVHQYALGLSIAGLSLCLLGSIAWARLQTVKKHFTKKSVKALDRTGRAIERLKTWLSPHKPNDGHHGPSERL
ncbi:MULTISPECIES: hypothetical protein [Streptomyces]|uniref:Uncharacterized protein n=1 Tax=Streptomyces durocortorensis TaxID=2811104 RepID=A0ABS2I4X0_9ACTN|nr:hypothetical protein [Streptomyces durocortorensis]MBM7057173.1 hypothetical protein [Streptomyces durocortorensis]